MKNPRLASMLLAFGSALPAATSIRSQTPPPQPLTGQIIIDPDDTRWLKRHGGDHLFICGPGDPEDFLYRGTRDPDGTRTGDQVALIRKLIEHGGNSIYLQAVRTHGGDAKTDTSHNPFRDSDPAKGVDPRILAQWEEWFTLMDENGILIYLMLYDDSARVWNTGDRVGPAERAFVETIVRTFRHHKNLIWIFGEESEERYSHARVNAVAGIIQRADPHGHVIGNHHLNGTTFKAWRAGGALRHFSMQMRAATGAEAHAAALEGLRNAAGRYQVIYAESTTTPPDPAGMRRHAWGVAMAGVMPMLLQMNIADTPVEALQQCRHLQRFFEATDFHTMHPHDELKHAGTVYVLADPGRSYIAYGDNVTGELGLTSVPAGKCSITWLDCMTGKSATEQHRFSAPGARSFRKPAQFGTECAAWIRFADIRPGKTTPRPAEATVASAPRVPNRPPQITDQSVAVAAGKAVNVQLAFTDDDGPGPYSYTIVRGPLHGVLSGEDNDRTYMPAAGFSGEDRFTWKASDGQADSGIGTVTIRVGPGGPRLTGDFPVPESKGGWRKLDRPEDVRRIGGMDPAKLAELREWLLASDQRNFAATVIRHGHVVLEVERGNSAKTDARRVASVSKAVCATVLAIASELSQQGRTPRKMSFTDPAFQFIPSAHPLSDPRKAQVTVRQLFNTTSGICPESTGASNNGTWDYVLGHTGDARLARLAFDPGTGSGYSTHAIYHAALVCENVTGTPYDQVAIKHLFEPLGCEHWWFQYFEGEKHAGPNHAMGMPARDLARIAYCMLHQGKWNGRQVIPRWFVDEVANGPTHSLRGVKELRTGRDAAGYSHAWELPTSATTLPEPWSEHIPKDARFKRGSGGQIIAYVPSLDLVVTRQTGGSGQWQYEEYLARVCLAVVNPTR